jgi:hypothetical protein
VRASQLSSGTLTVVCIQLELDGERLHAEEHNFPLSSVPCFRSFAAHSHMSPVVTCCMLPIYSPISYVIHNWPPKTLSPITPQICSSTAIVFIQVSAMKIHFCFATVFCVKLVSSLGQDTTSHLRTAVLDEPVEAKEVHDQHSDLVASCAPGVTAVDYAGKCCKPGQTAAFDKWGYSFCCPGGTKLASFRGECCPGTTTDVLGRCCAAGVTEVSDFGTCCRPGQVSASSPSGFRVCCAPGTLAADNNANCCGIGETTVKGVCCAAGAKQDLRGDCCAHGVTLLDGNGSCCAPDVTMLDVNGNCCAAGVTILDGSGKCCAQLDRSGLCCAADRILNHRGDCCPAGVTTLDEYDECGPSR